MRTLLSILLLSCSFSAYAGGHAYSSWSTHKWNKLGSVNYRIDTARKNISVTYYSEHSSNTRMSLYLEEITERAYSYLSSHVRLDECANDNVVVYELTGDTLNSRSVLYWYPWRDSSQRLYGAYDSRYTTARNTSAVVIRSDLPTRTKQRILAHEMIHYWYDMCVSGDISRSETYAQTFEGFYR